MDRTKTNKENNTKGFAEMPKLFVKLYFLQLLFVTQYYKICEVLRKNMFFFLVSVLKIVSENVFKVCCPPSVRELILSFVHTT